MNQHAERKISIIIKGLPHSNQLNSNWYSISRNNTSCSAICNYSHVKIANISFVIQFLQYIQRFIWIDKTSLCLMYYKRFRNIELNRNSKLSISSHFLEEILAAVSGAFLCWCMCVCLIGLMTLLLFFANAKLVQTVPNNVFMCLVIAILFKEFFPVFFHCRCSIWFYMCIQYFNLNRNEMPNHWNFSIVPMAFLFTWMR